MTIGIVLDYQIRKRVYLVEAADNYSVNELIAIFTQIAQEFINTTPGALYFEKNNKKMDLHNLMEIRADIPSEIISKHGISFDSCACMSADVIEISAFTPLIETKPIMAYFGVYDQDYQINKSNMKKLIDSVSWDNDYAFRDLHYNDELVGFGFVSMDLIDPLEETDFNLEEFLRVVAEFAYKNYVKDASIYELHGISVKMLRLDW